MVSCLLPPSAHAQYFGRNKIQYSDFDWKVLNTPHFELFFYEGSEDLAARAAVIAEDAYVRLATTFDHSFSAQIPFILYASPNDFQQTNISDGLIGEGTGGFSEPLRNRMVLPYPGDNAGFVHVINHELVHVFMFDIVFHSTKSGMARRAFFPIELWFAEGMAEWFATGWDKNADMWLRDATIYDWVIPLDRIYGGYQVYKEGQAVMKFIAETYGEEKVVEFFKAVGRTRNVQRALEMTIGLDTKSLSKRWQKWLKLEYWPLYSDKQEAESIGRRLTNHWDERHYFNQQAALSPDGNYVAFFSDRDDFVKLFLMNAVDGSIIRELATGYRSNQFLSFHSFDSGISFNAASTRIAFIAKSGSQETLYVMRLRDGRILQSIPLGMDIARSPEWNPVRDQVILTGTNDGQTDLFLIDLDTERILKVTSDLDSEFSPTWYPSGNKVLYSAYANPTMDVEVEELSNGVRRMTDVDFQSTANVRREVSRALYSLDLSTSRVERVLSTGGDDTDPVVIDDDNILFISDVSGIANLYWYDLTSRRFHRFTDVLTGISVPSYAPAADRLSFVAFDRAGFDIFVIENLIEYARDNQYPDPVDERLASAAASGELSGEAGAGRVLTVNDLLAPGSGLSEGDGSGGSAGVGTLGSPGARDNGLSPLLADSDSTQSGTDSTRVALADAGEIDRLAQEDPLTKKPIGTVENYRPRFSLEPLGSGGGGISYSSGLGLGVSNVITLSDLLGNHRLSFLVNFYGSIKTSDLAASYWFLGRRTNYGIGIFHYRNFFNSSFTTLGEVFDRSQFFTERNYGAFALASRPFDQFTRADFEVQAYTSDRTIYKQDPQTGVLTESERRVAELVQPSLSFVHDSAFYGPFGPVTGSRWYLSFAPAIPIKDSALNRVTGFVDYRKYIQVFSRNSLVFRAVGAVSNGSDPRIFVVGGPFTLRGWDSFDFERTTPNGDPLNPNLIGSRMVMANFEYRFPFVDALFLGWPGRIGFGPFGAVAFFDVGSAFTEDFQPFGKTEAGNLILKDLNADYGFGIRMHLGWLPMKFDWGWKWDFVNSAATPQFNFSIAPEF